MGTVLSTFQYDPKSRDYRDRITMDRSPKFRIVSSGNVSPDLAFGSYKRIIDSSKTSTHNYLYKNPRNLLAHGVNTNIFVDTGGPLWIEEFSICDPPRVHVGRKDWSGRLVEDFDGPFIVNRDHYSMYRSMALQKFDPQPLLGLAGKTFSEMCAYGSTGISRSIPTIPLTSTFTILGELREGLASIPGRQLYKLMKESPKWANRIQLLSKGGSSEFLNWIFGLAPTLKDVDNLYAINTDDVKQIRSKLNGEVHKIYKRRRVVEKEHVETTDGNVDYPQYTPSIYVLSGGWCQNTVVTDSKVWFSGAFDHSAWAPTIDSRLNDLLNAGEDLGLLPTADRFWQLIPYSWLVDWFLNFGDVLTNISFLGRSGMQMLYGYVMADTTRTRTSTWSGYVNGHYSNFTTVSSERIRQRVRATPYGFGLKLQDLSPMQLAILASLGITRTKLIRSGSIPKP
ncbi:TPA_asm: maturation protein [ssRNA phage SRR7976323_5]|uniref:Maturation protein n=1 Tax=ssRNA phage SRR7976323_5 TaxID=2786692 RepID=A0A8S5L145_9VIRU|nr:maturation protein [ssRNA phage SRR7976323_5]DAD51156.1 TPA_asm: maturation protein [ssRNA phage SRR7976323_5]